MAFYPGTFIQEFLAAREASGTKSWKPSGDAPRILVKIFSGNTVVVNGMQYFPQAYIGSYDNLAELIQFCKDRHEELEVISEATNPWACSSIRQLLKFLEKKKPIPAPRKRKMSPVPAPRPPVLPASPVPGTTHARLVRLCIVRIGPSREVALRDYASMKETPNDQGLFTWDKDHANKIRVGDILGFILGSGAETYLEYYHIIEEGTTRERNGSWNVGQPYQGDNGESSVSHRQVIRMKEMTNPQVRLWSDLKTQLGYSPGCASWMPRGTMVVSDERLPAIGALFQ